MGSARVRCLWRRVYVAFTLALGSPPELKVAGSSPAGHKLTEAPGRPGVSSFLAIRWRRPSMPPCHLSVAMRALHSPLQGGSARGLDRPRPRIGHLTHRVPLRRPSIPPLAPHRGRTPRPGHLRPGRGDDLADPDRASLNPARRGPRHFHPLGRQARREAGDGVSGPGGHSRLPGGLLPGRAARRGQGGELAAD